MNDEISEILDNLIKNKEKLKDKTYYPEDLINSEDLILLLDYITNLQKENERLKELVDADNESYDIQETIINRQKSELLEQEDYKSRCEKASEYFKYQLENLDFYEDTKARMLCAMGITLLQNGSENK